LGSQHPIPAIGNVQLNTYYPRKGFSLLSAGRPEISKKTPHIGRRTAWEGNAETSLGGARRWWGKNTVSTSRETPNRAEERVVFPSTGNTCHGFGEVLKGTRPRNVAVKRACFKRQGLLRTRKTVTITGRGKKHKGRDHGGQRFIQKTSSKCLG